MCLPLMNFQPIQKPGQLPVINFANIGSVFRPPKKLFFQPFLPQTETVPVPVQNFDQIPQPVAEHE
jgi:hypothetical protein